MNARSTRRLPEEDFPAHGLPHEKLVFATQYAALAPTENDWQPWKFRITDTHVELRTKTDLPMAAADPDGRELMISCGSALQYLKVALKYFGCLGQVSLFPDLGESALVATVRLGSGLERDAKYLFEAMTAGRSRLSPAGGNPVSETMLAVLSHAAARERGWLDFAQSEMSRQQVMEMTHADGPNHATAGGQHVSRWFHPFLAFGDRNIDPEDPWSVTDDDEKSESAATLAVVKTKTDDKHGWLAAGQTMARTILEAEALGLAWAFFDPVRRREARAALRLGVGHKGFAQVILCFGALTAGEMMPPLSRETATVRFR
jgi:hypothetical protein